MLNSLGRLVAKRPPRPKAEKCPQCEGIFFDCGELETLLLKHDTHRRGFFRRLLGFHGG